MNNRNLEISGSKAYHTGNMCVLVKSGLNGIQGWLRKNLKKSSSALGEA